MRGSIGNQPGLSQPQRLDWNESGNSQKEKALGISVTVLGLSPQDSLSFFSSCVLGALCMLGIWLIVVLGSYLRILPREKGKLGGKSLGVIPFDLEIPALGQEFWV